MKRPHWPLRQGLIALLISSGSAALVAPLLAQTAPGTIIRNTFTGTYDGMQAPAVSNEVTLVISEVAGITVQAQSPSNPGPDPDDNLFVDFVITNTGNDPTTFFLPDTVTLGGAGAASFTAGTLVVTKFNGTALPTPVPIPNGGAETGAFPNGGLPDGGSINPGATVVVRVPITVKGTAQKGDRLNVSLGNTTPADAQNQPYTANGGSVYTVDNAGTDNGDSNGAPVNGDREAMDTASPIVVGATFQAFTKILLAQTYSNNQTPGVITDDRLDYCLALNVADTVPEELVDVLPSDLNPTEISLDGVLDSRVLIADAIPANMQLTAAAPTAPTSVPGWQVVYTTSALTTPAHQAQWTTTRPTTGITRVGFVIDQSVQQGSTIGGGSDCFKFSVEAQPSFPGGRIENIAQVFGQSQPGPVLANTPTQLVYDESGDQTLNNGLLRDNPDPESGGIAAANGGITNGVATLEVDGADPGRGADPTASDTNQGLDSGDNAGTKAKGGETLIFNLVPAPINGPDQKPGAIGPNNDNDDFTSKLLMPPAALDPALPLNDEQTPPVTFTNTVRNSSITPQVISLLPTRPIQPDALPDGTVVTLTNPVNGQTATYRYTAAGGFEFVSGAGGPSATQPVQLQVGTGEASQASYTVVVNLPSAKQLQEYPIPITAFVDQGTPGLDPDDPANVTINRLYTGFIKVTKEARILDEEGTTELVGFTTDQSKLAPEVKNDRFIEYRLIYSNLAQAQGSGADNIILPATNFVLTEDGKANGNTWFELTDDPNAASRPSSGSATATLGTIATVTTEGDIQTYTVTVPDFQPGESGTLIFRRQIQK